VTQRSLPSLGTYPRRRSSESSSGSSPRSDLNWDRGIPHREGATTFTFAGTTDRAPFPGLSEDERTRHKGELIYPNLMLSMSSDHVTAFTLWPKGPDRTVIDCDFLFHPEEMARLGFDA
jgi:Rieske 2Fe-2S family protein